MKIRPITTPRNGTPKDVLDCLTNKKVNDSVVLRPSVTFLMKKFGMSDTRARALLGSK